MSEVRLPTPLLVHVFPCFEAGGVQLRTLDLIRALGERFEHELVTLDDGRSSNPDLVRQGAFRNWHQLPKRGSLRTTLALRRLFRRQRPDLLLSYDWGAIDALFANSAGQRRAPLVHHEDGFAADEACRLKRRRTIARRLALHGATRVVVPSTDMQAIARGPWRVPSTKLVRIENGIDLERFVPGRDSSTSRRAWQLPTDAPIVGTACRLSTIKRIDRLLAAFARLGSSPRPHLAIAGEGPERGRLERRAAELGIEDRVHWLGFVDRPETLYPAFDVFALSSDREVQPRAMLEAMACGRAVVATDVGDVRNILPAAQHPYLSPVGDGSVEALSAAMRTLLASTDEREDLGKQNRERVVTRHSRTTMRERFEKLFREALEQGNR